jgi:hypothetical protein
MKRITRTYNDHVTHRPERVWLDQTGHWTHDKALVGEFEDYEASRRVRRIPHAELESIENKPQENGDAM